MIEAKKRDFFKLGPGVQRGVIRTWVYGFGTVISVFGCTVPVRVGYGLVTVWLRFG